MKFHIKTKYVDEQCVLVFSRYQHGTHPLALRLFSAETKEPQMTVTVYLAFLEQMRNGSFFPHSQIVVKTWSENEGIVEALQKAKIITDTPPTPYPVNDYGSLAMICQLSDEVHLEAMRQTETEVRAQESSSRKDSSHD